MYDDVWLHGSHELSLQKYGIHENHNMDLTWSRVWFACFQRPNSCMNPDKPYIGTHTVKLTRAKLPANAGDFTHGLHVKRHHTQFTCVTCGLPVKTGKFTPVYAANTSRRIYANCLQPHVNLLEYNEYFTGNFACGTHANLPATSMQICQLSQEKMPAVEGKMTSNRTRKTLNCKQNYPQLQAKKRAIAVKNTRINRQNTRHWILKYAQKFVFLVFAGQRHISETATRPPTSKCIKIIIQITKITVNGVENRKTVIKKTWKTDQLFFRSNQSIFSSLLVRELG